MLGHLVGARPGHYSAVVAAQTHWLQRLFNALFHRRH